MLTVSPINPTTFQQEFSVRFLGGVRLPVCESCRLNLAVIRAWDSSDAFLVCWECRP